MIPRNGHRRINGPVATLDQQNDSEGNRAQGNNCQLIRVQVMHKFILAHLTPNLVKTLDKSILTILIYLSSTIAHW